MCLRVSTLEVPGPRISQPRRMMTGWEKKLLSRIAKIKALIAIGPIGEKGGPEIGNRIIWIFVDTKMGAGRYR